jgi:hypothetical protein
MPIIYRCKQCYIPCVLIMDEKEPEDLGDLQCVYKIPIKNAKWEVI